MKNRYFVAIIVIVVAILFVSGFFFSDQQIDIAGCTAKWRVVSTTVPQSELCPSQSCVASSADQQHNAIVSALLCACDKAKANQYADETTNKRIEEVVLNFFGYTVNAPEVCEQPGTFLTKRSYG